MLAFYDFPAEHWTHIRTTNPIESTFRDGVQAAGIGTEEREKDQRIKGSKDQRIKGSKDQRIKGSKDQRIQLIGPGGQQC